MQTRIPPITVEDGNTGGVGTSQDKVFFEDTEFGKATLKEMAAFAEGQDTILLEELRAEVA